jgi:UDP-glucose 4-epimerase
MTRVLVTGGSGFLGRSVVASLTREGATVLSTDLKRPSSLPEGARFEAMDVTDADEVGRVFAGFGPEVVVHLASIVNPGEGTTPEIEFEVDVNGSRNVLGACLDHGVRRVVVSSSGAAYGYHADNPEWIGEDWPVRGTETFPYSRHKQLVEELLADLRLSAPELEQVVLRIGTILGNEVDNQITELFEKPRLLKVAGHASPFVFIWDEDVVAVIVRAVADGPPGIYNVAGDGAMTVDEIAATMDKSTLAVSAWLLRAGLFVANRLGLSPHGPDQIDFLRYRPVLDNARLKKVFGYSPEKSSRQAFAAWLEARRQPAGPEPSLD